MSGDLESVWKIATPYAPPAISRYVLGSAARATNFESATGTLPSPALATASKRPAYLLCAEVASVFSNVGGAQRDDAQRMLTQSITD